MYKKRSRCMWSSWWEFSTVICSSDPPHLLVSDLDEVPLDCRQYSRPRRVGSARFHVVDVVTNFPMSAIAPSSPPIYHYST
jgi:hypothetical protein